MTQRFEENVFVLEVIARQSLKYPLSGEFSIAVPAFTVLIEGVRAFGSFFHSGSVSPLIVCGSEPLAEYGSVTIEKFIGGIKTNSQTQRSTTTHTGDALSIATGDSPMSGCLSKEVENTTELALLELKRMVRKGVAPDHCHGRKFRLQVLHNFAIHAFTFSV
jgi:hypothetical protein